MIRNNATPNSEKEYMFQKNWGKMAISENNLAYK